MSDVSELKEKASKIYLDYRIEPAERVEMLNPILKEIGKGEYLKQKTLFDIFLRPLKYLFDKNHRYDFLNLYAITMHFFTENDFDYVSVVMGMEGIGKSSLALNLGTTLSKFKLENGGYRSFDIENIIFAKDNFKDASRKMLSFKNSVIMFDEARSFFDLRMSMSPERLQQLEIITTERYRRNIYLLCVSDINEIDKYFRERRARTCFVIPDRGIFFALQNKAFFGMGEDRFGLEKLNNSITYSNVSYRDSISILASLPTNFGYGFFNKVHDSKLWEEYRKMKELSYEKYKRKSILEYNF